MSLVEAYADFDLLITRAGAEFSVTVVKSLAGEAHTSFVWPFAPGEIEGFHLHLAGSRHAEVVGEEAAGGGLGEELGTRLFDAVFSGPVRNCYRTIRELARERKLIFRLELRLADPRLETAPWEHLKDPELGDPLALEIPIFRTLAVPKERRRMPVPPPLRVLAVLANPLSDHPLAIEEEWRGLKAALGGLEKSGRVALERLGRPTLSALNGYLRHHECHVLHFVGHGEPGALVLEDEEGRPIRVSRDRLGTFCRHEPLRLAVLNVCEGAHAAGRDAFTGVGQKLIQKGTPAVIAMQAEISDAAAITFARHLYGSLAEELTVS